jgi:hypothetical protein
MNPHNLSPHRYYFQGFGVANNIKSITSSATGNINPVVRFEEPWTALGVASDGGQDDNLGFFTLKVIAVSLLAKWIGEKNI